MVDEELMKRCDLQALADTAFKDEGVESDPDFELSHFQLIKVVKILTYQMTILDERTEMKNSQMQANILQKLDYIEGSLKQQVS